MNKNNIRFIGKHLEIDNQECFSFSGSGFEFNIVPITSSFIVTILLESKMREEEAQYLSIYVDENFLRKEKLLNGNQQIEIKLNKKKPTIIRVIKENETHISTIYLKDILLKNASFENIEPSNRPLIGFFGDSLTCGYGLLDYKGLTFKTECEEFSKSYAYLTSFALNMDYLVVARSGISVALKIYCDRLFKEVYDTVDMYQKCSFDRKVDYAVFNLGTNDSGAYSLMDEKDKEPSRQLFIKEYIQLIERIIKDNPGVKIVIIYNMVLIEEKMNDAIKEVKEYIDKHYDNKVELLKFVPNGDGGSGHPYYPNHLENSELLVETIKKMG